MGPSKLRCKLPPRARISPRSRWPVISLRNSMDRRRPSHSVSLRSSYFRSDGAVEVTLQTPTEGTDLASLEMARDFVKKFDGQASAKPLRFTSQQVFLGDHFKNGADILRHATMDQDQAPLKALACLAGNFCVSEYLVIRKEAAAADPELGIAVLCANALNELDTRPYTA